MSNGTCFLLHCAVRPLVTHYPCSVWDMGQGCKIIEEVYIEEVSSCKRISFFSVCNIGEVLGVSNKTKRVEPEIREALWNRVCPSLIRRYLLSLLFLKICL